MEAEEEVEEEERLQKQRKVEQEKKVIAKLTSPCLLELQTTLDENRSV